MGTLSNHYISSWRDVFFNRVHIFIKIRGWNEKFNTVNYLGIEYKELSKIKRVWMETSSEDIKYNSRDKILTTKTPQVWGKIVRLIKD